MRRKRIMSAILVAILFATLGLSSLSAKFWGRANSPSRPSYTYIDSETHKQYIVNCYDYYIFWIRVDTDCERQEVDSSQNQYE